MIENADIIGESEALNRCLDYADAVAESDAAVLVTGESGVGKELIANRIHTHSPRSQGKLITVNCASVPRDLFESEFFGHVKGAFTGAARDRVGRFEAAHRGTLFLDEVGEIPPELQGKLLRALQQSTFERVGEDRTRHVVCGWSLQPIVRSRTMSRVAGSAGTSITGSAPSRSRCRPCASEGTTLCRLRRNFCSGYRKSIAARRRR